MSNCPVSNHEPYVYHTSNITPELQTRYSTSLLLDDFQLIGKQTESWDSLGFADLSKSQATGKGGRGFNPESFSYETGKVFEKNTHKKMDINPDVSNSIKQNAEQESSELTAIEKHNVSLGMDSYSTAKRVDKIYQKTIQNDDSSATQINKVTPHRTNELKRRFDNDSELTPDNLSNADPAKYIAYEKKKKAKVGANVSESEAFYVKLMNKYVTSVAKPSLGQHQNIIQHDKNRNKKLIQLQQATFSLDQVEAQVLKGVINKAKFENKFTPEITNDVTNQHHMINQNQHVISSIDLKISDGQQVNGSNVNRLNKSATDHSGSNSKENEMPFSESPNEMSFINMLKRYIINPSSTRELVYSVNACLKNFSNNKKVYDSLLNNNSFQQAELSLSFLEEYGVSQPVILALKQQIASQGIHKKSQLFFMQLHHSLKNLPFDLTDENTDEVAPSKENLSDEIPNSSSQQSIPALKSAHDMLVNSLKSILQSSAIDSNAMISSLANHSLEQNLSNYIKTIKDYSANSNSAAHQVKSKNEHVSSMSQLKGLFVLDKLGVSQPTIEALNSVLISLEQQPQNEIITLLKEVAIHHKNRHNETKIDGEQNQSSIKSDELNQIFSKGYYESHQQFHAEKVTHKGKFGHSSITSFKHAHEINVNIQRDDTSLLNNTTNSDVNLLHQFTTNEKSLLPVSMSENFPIQNRTFSSEHSDTASERYAVQSKKINEYQSSETKQRFKNTTPIKSALPVTVNVGRITYVSEESAPKSTTQFKRPAPSMTLADYNSQRGNEDE